MNKQQLQKRQKELQAQYNANQERINQMEQALGQLKEEQLRLQGRHQELKELEGGLDENKKERSVEEAK